MRGMVAGALAAASGFAAAVLASAGGQQAAMAGAPQDCFWVQTFDTANSNIVYPDTAVNYYLGRVNLPPRGEMVLRGRFPHARYMSVNAYDEVARPTDALADVEIRPDRGSTNPFVEGHRRDLSLRDYTVRVVAESAPTDRAPNTVYLGSNGRPTFSGSIVYRIYLPDRDRNEFGGTGLPEATLRLPDGTEVEQPAACTAGTQQPSTGLTDTNRRSSGPTTPNYRTATDPLSWGRFFNAPHSVARQYSEELGDAVPARQSGGYFSDDNNAYVSASTARAHGEVLVVRGRMPDVADTYLRDQQMEADAQMRYWSMCHAGSGATGVTDTVDCVFDEEVPTTADGWYTVVVSTPEDRPANARTACGVAWVAHGARAEGVLIMRNQLSSPHFAHAIQEVSRPGQEEQVMDAYLPRGTYGSTGQFEQRGCGVGG